jgi:Domain of unknown function (DUF4432)
MNRGVDCSVVEVVLDRAVRAVRLENDLLASTVLVDKGADVYELIYKPKGIDVLWKSPWGLRRPGGGYPSAFQSSVTWIEAYEGGWQELFPNGGDPASYKGVELSFHGEASTAAWDYRLASGDGWAELRLSLRLARSPFRIARTMRVEHGSPSLHLAERISNEGGEPMDYMWGHHPAYGAPFLSAACRIDTNGTTLVADDSYAPPANPLDLVRSYRWPTGGRGEMAIDLSRVPGPDEERAMLGYFTEFADGHAWYGVTNTELGFGIGLVWPVAAFPYAWFWQEMHASPGFPWYKNSYVMAIEPGTSYPGQGLVNAIEKTGTHRTLQPGESATAELRAIFYEAATGVAAISADGRVTGK